MVHESRVPQVNLGLEIVGSEKGAQLVTTLWVTSSLVLRKITSYHIVILDSKVHTISSTESANLMFNLDFQFSFVAIICH